MKIKLTQPGFENYTGQMGVIQFENGLSVSDVLQIDAVRLSAVMQCHWEDGTTASVAQRLLDEANTPAPTQTQVDEARRLASEAQVIEQVERVNLRYTAEELGAIADEKGIAGLRAIADELGIKGNSIAGLIDAILKAPGKAE